MNKKAAIFMVIFSVLIGLFVIYISFLPSIMVTETKVEIKAPRSKIDNYLHTSMNWQDWILSRGDHSISLEQTSKPSGVGSAFRWYSDVEGNGALELKSITDSALCFEMITDDNRFRNRGWLKFEGDSTSETTIITWVDSFDISNNWKTRLSAGNEDFQELARKSNQMNLDRLKANLEQ